MRLVEGSVFLLLSAIWGSAFLLIKYAALEFPPFTLVAIRMLLAGVVMVAGCGVGMAVSREFRATARQTLRSREFYWKVAVMGFLNNAVPFTLVAWAESEASVNVGAASVLDSTIPLFAQLFGHFALSGTERLTARKAIGLFVGFLGVFGVCSVKLFNLDGRRDITHTSTSMAILYYLMIIFASASYGLASVFGKLKLSSQYNPVVTACGQICWGALLVTVAAVAWDYNGSAADNFQTPDDLHFGFFRRATLRGWLSLVYLGLVSTCVAYLCYFYLLATIGSVRQTMVGFLLPVFGVFEGAIALKEWSGIAWYCKVIEVVGALLIGAGIYFVNFSAPPANATGSEEEKQSLLADGSINGGGGAGAGGEKAGVVGVGPSTTEKLVDGFVHGGMPPSGSEDSSDREPRRAPTITSYGNVQAYA